MTSLDATARSSRAGRGRPEGHADESSEKFNEPAPVPPIPQFGLSYRVTPAARFDRPNEVLGELLSCDLSDIADVDDLIGHLSVPATDEPRSWSFAGHIVGVVGDRAVVVTVDRSVSAEVGRAVLVGVLHHWRQHLIDVPKHLDRVSVEAAAAQRRIAAISWLESGVAIAAGHGWSVEANRLSSIRNRIADGARTQNSTMQGAGESWVAVRHDFAQRRPGDASVESVVAALDQLLGS